MGGGVIGWAISRPVSVAVGVILVIMFGVLSVRDIPIQLTPDVTIPSVSVQTVWPGASPAEIEAEILEAQEEALKRLPGLVRMTSEARRNQGTINLELQVGASLDQALVRVSNLLSQVSDYPTNAREPSITTADSSGPPLVVSVVRSVPAGRSVAEYRTWMDEVIVPRLERIDGVASIRLVGGQEEEFQIDIDVNRLAALHVTIGQVATAVRGELVDVSGGDIPEGRRRYLVRTVVVPEKIEQLERTVIKSGVDGTPVLLGQIAKVRRGLRKPEAVGLFNGSPSMALLFFREAGSNVLEVTKEIYRVNQELQDKFLDREGLEMTIVSDQTEYIEGALDLVESNLLIGGALAVLVLLLFLRSVGASAVVALSIPISIVGTALMMSLFGRTINIVSLAGMAFAIGMVVDNSIVVLENIDTWRKREANVARASLMATREVWGAILASTLTTAAVFIPIIAWQDEVGELLRDIAVAVSTAVFVSLVVSVVVIPSFAARLLRGRVTGDEAPEEVGRIGRTVHWITRSKLRSLALSVGGVGGLVGLSLAMVPSMEYLPTGNRNIIFGVVLPPTGASVAEVERIGSEVQGRLLPHLNVEKDGVPAIHRTFFVGSPDQVFSGAVAVDPDRVSELAAFVRKALVLPDVIGFANQGSLFGRSFGGSRSIEVDITGTDLRGMTGFAAQLMGAIKAVMPEAQVRPIPGLDEGAPELRVEPRRAQAAALGMTSSELGLLVDVYVDGAIIGEVATGGETKRDVVMRATGIDVTGREALINAPAAVPRSDVPVPVGNVATVRELNGPTTIQRIERRRALTLQVSPPDDIALEEAISLVRDGAVGKLGAQGLIPADVRVDYSGSAGKLEEAQTRFVWVLLFALLITFLLLAALFEDFLAPIAILVTVPLAGAGGVFGLWLVNRFVAPQPLDMLTALGFVILIGVVVNNAILIVDGTLTRMREREMSLEDAVASAVRWRVRPILMSVLTSMVGLLPLVIFPGSGSELYRGVGSVVLGGLALSTALSLFIVPAVFTTLWRARRAVAAGLSRARA